MWYAAGSVGDEGHQYFISVLEETLCILKPLASNEPVKKRPTPVAVTMRQSKTSSQTWSWRTLMCLSTKMSTHRPILRRCRSTYPPSSMSKMRESRRISICVLLLDQEPQRPLAIPTTIMATISKKGDRSCCSSGNHKYNSQPGSESGERIRYDRSVAKGVYR